MKNNKKYKEANKRYVKLHREKIPKRAVLSDITLSQITHKIEVLSDIVIRQYVMFKGFIAVSNSVLSDTIEEISNQYYIRGSELSKASFKQLTEIINGKTFNHSKSETKDSVQI